MVRAVTCSNQLFCHARHDQIDQGRNPVATITMPARMKSENKDTDVRFTIQDKQILQRYRLQVDRQVKSSFDSLEAAEKIGKSIKKAHPVVQVSIYDSKEGDTKVID